MRGKIFKLSENEEDDYQGDCLGTIVCMGETCVLRTENEDIKSLISPLLNQPIKVRVGGGEDGFHGTMIKEIEPGHGDFLHYLKYELFKFELWIEIED